MRRPLLALTLSLAGCVSTPTAAGISRDLDAQLRALATWPLATRCQAVYDAAARCGAAGLPSDCAWDERFDASTEDACWAIMACKTRETP